MHKPKRRKTQTACLYCRQHKLKCDFSSESADATSPICKHCKDFGIDCQVIPRVKAKRASTLASSPSSSKGVSTDNQAFRRSQAVPLTEPRYAGPTSLSQLVSAVTRKWPSRADQMLVEMDPKYGFARVENISGGPFIMLPQVRYPPEQMDSSKMERATLSRAAKQFLLVKYQRFLAPIFCVLSDKESTDAVELGVEDQLISTLSNLGLALLSIAAMLRDTPMETRMALLYHLRRRSQVEISSSIETVQYLTILCANIEILSPDSNASSGMNLNLTGLLIRMAQDLGLHRDISSLKTSNENVNRRSRIWASCVIVDRWYSISYGQPCLINSDDCDAPPPSPYADNYEGGKTLHGLAKPHEAHVEHIKLSALIARLLRLVFTPAGMKNTSIEDMQSLKRDLDAWTDNLPPTLRLLARPNIRQTSIGGGLLHLLKVAVDFIYYRAASVSPCYKNKSTFMAPPHVWDDIVKRSAEAIDWIATPDGTSILDAWSIAMYGMIQCCLVQFYATIDGRDPEPLRVARKCLQSWGSSIETQSHGYYEPTQGDEPLSSSKMTAVQSDDAIFKGKKSLTLRTKAYTVVAMLAGIADHHVANRNNRPLETLSNGTKSFMASSKPELHNFSSLTNSTSIPTSLSSTSSSSSPYNFNSVLNHQDNVASLSMTNCPASIHPTMQQTPSSSSLYPSNLSNSNNLLSSTGISPNYTGFQTTDIEQIDLLTLQRWADEIMGESSHLDINLFSQQQQQSQQQHYL